MENSELTVNMELMQGFEFKVSFDEKWADLVMDEPEPIGANHGPNAARVLAAAIGNCLSASLLFSLRKTRVEPKSLKTRVTFNMTRNEKGRLRIGSGHVTITVATDPDYRNRLDRCLGLFEDYCIVTQSVRSGIDVTVEVLDDRGEVLHDTRTKSA